SPCGRAAGRGRTSGAAGAARAAVRGRRHAVRLGRAAREQAPCLRSASHTGRWGDLQLLIDTSAFARASHPEVRRSWQEALCEDRPRLPPPARMEIVCTARDGVTFDALAAELSVAEVMEFESIWLAPAGT